MEPGLRAYTPWGEIAYRLAGREGYERVRASDEHGGAPGADTIKELFGGEPTLILIDELSVYLRKLKAKDRDGAGGQLTAFLTALFKAVEGTPNAVVVYTLAIGKGGQSTDAYSAENRFIADKMEEAESVSARKAALLDPTEEDETVRILRRRLFAHIDDARAAEVVDAYRKLWDTHRDHLPPQGAHDGRAEALEAGYPLHPELIATLREKTSTLGNFQRVRGMLRLLARTVARLWEQRPADAYAIHLHHLDPGFEPIRQEIVTRLGQRQLVPAIKADVAAVEGDQRALAQTMDTEHRHVLYPSRNRIDGANLDLAHTAIDVQSASNKPGQGQKQVVEVLRANNKLRLPEDDPDSPAYIRDRTPLKKGKITTATLRAEFRRDPGLPMLVGDDVFVKGIRRGIEAGVYVDPTDGFRLLGVVSGIQQADKGVSMQGGYETKDGGTLEIDFSGGCEDAQPLKDFLEPQLRAAKDKTLDLSFAIAFADAGLSLSGEAPEKLGERLTRFGAGAAYVSITAEGGT